MAQEFDREWSREEELPDGTTVLLRLLRPEDREALVAGFERLSAESRYLRFFTAMPKLPAAVLEELMRKDDDHLAIVATSLPTDENPAPEGYGVARFIRLPDAADTAEAAVTVVDSMQRRGIGTLLLTHLTDAARERGITKFRAEVMRQNAGVSALLRDLDVHAQPIEEDGPRVVYLFDVPPEPSGPLFQMLQLAGKGLDLVMRYLPGFGTND